MDSLYLLLSPPMPHMLATLGLVDENKGSPHPVPSLLEHLPLKRQLSKDNQATTGSLYLAACLVGGMGGIAGNPAGKLPTE